MNQFSSKRQHDLRVINNSQCTLLNRTIFARIVKFIIIIFFISNHSSFTSGCDRVSFASSYGHFCSSSETTCGVPFRTIPTCPAWQLWPSTCGSMPSDYFQSGWAMNLAAATVPKLTVAALAFSSVLNSSGLSNNSFIERGHLHPFSDWFVFEVVKFAPIRRCANGQLKIGPLDCVVQS